MVIGSRQQNGIQALPPDIGVKSIKTMVILDNNNRDNFKLSLEDLDMLNLYKDVICNEHNECKVEVPGPDFSTQGVSSRRDVDYYI